MNKIRAITYALLAAVFYAVNVPLSKILLDHVGPTTMAALLYLGAGLGIGLLSLLRRGDRQRSEKLDRKDLPYVLGMIVLDIAAPIFLMLGISIGSSANASLLGNFEIVATTLIALFVFGEAVTGRLWAAIGLITLSSIMLSFEGAGSFSFSYGSLFVLLATVCWGLENNCTRQIADRDPMQIVTIKGFGSGLGALAIAFAIGEHLPHPQHLAIILLLGYVAYGLSIYFYTYAQRAIGAAKTSTYYALAPFIGALLSIIMLGEPITPIFVIASAIMAAGCWVAAK